MQNGFRAPSRRQMLLGLGAVGLAPIGAARAKTALPDKAIRIVVGYGAGSASDLLAQVMVPEIERRLGRRVSIDNKSSGAGSGSSAGNFLKRAPADGSVIALMPSHSLATKLINARYAFDPVKDFVPLTVVGAYQMALAVSPKIGVSTLADYAEWLKAGDAERARAGVIGGDSFLRVFGQMIGREIGTEIDIVTGRGAIAMLADLQSGKSSAGFGVVTSFLESHRGGRVKMLVTSGKRRLRAARTVPTVVDLGYPNLETDEWFGFFAPAATPAPVVEEWNQQLTAVIAESTIAVELAQLGLQVETSTPEEAMARLASYMQGWKNKLAAFGIKTVD